LNKTKIFQQTLVLLHHLLYLYKGIVLHRHSTQTN